MTQRKQPQGVLLIGGFVATCVCGESIERKGNQWAKFQTRKQAEDILRQHRWEYSHHFGWKCPQCVERDNREKEKGRG